MSLSEIFNKFTNLGDEIQNASNSPFKTANDLREAIRVFSYQFNLLYGELHDIAPRYPNPVPNPDFPDEPYRIIDYLEDADSVAAEWEDALHQVKRARQARAILRMMAFQIQWFFDAIQPQVDGPDIDVLSEFERLNPAAAEAEYEARTAR